MNRREQIQLSPDEQAAFLREHTRAALATLDPKGFPHVVAMSYVVADGVFYMTSYGKAQKVVNIRRNPKVAVLVEDGRDYAELRGVMVRGHCDIIEEPEAVRAAQAAVARAQGRGPVTDDSVDRAPKRVVLKIVPRTVITWDHTKLGGRY